MDVDGYEQFAEFVLIGVVLGVVEDLIAFYFATGGRFPITLETLGIVTAVAIPFAAFSELVVDD